MPLAGPRKIQKYSTLSRCSGSLGGGWLALRACRIDDGAPQVAPAR